MKTVAVFRGKSRVGVSRWPRVFGVVMAMIMTILLVGCSGQANRSDEEVAKSAKTTHLSPEQCNTGAQIDQAAAMVGPDGSYLIQAGDELSVEFYLSPEFNDQVTVRPDGEITLRVVGDVKAAGLTPAQLATYLDHAYLSELRSPDAVVHVKSMPSRLVYVEGQVNKPGSFPLDNGMTVVQAVSDAGGLTDQAGKNAVLIRRDMCGQPAGMKVNLATAMQHPERGEDVALMSRDVIVVPRSGIANLDLVVQQYIRGLLPIEPYLSFPGPAL